MPSDLAQKKKADSEAKKPSAQILREEISEGLNVFARSPSQLFISGLSAGLDVGFSLFLMAVMETQTKDILSEPVRRILVANMYSVGFIFVVLGRSELFTEQTTLAVLPVFNGDKNVASLGKLWSIVYVANLIGAVAFAALAVMIGPTLGVMTPQALGSIAHRLTDHPAQVIFASAVLAGWLMGLLSWLVTASRDTVGQIVIVWLITTAIGFAGLHHVVLGTVEVLGGAFAGQGISLADVARFLLFATLGNAFGGAFFVGLIKYGNSHKPERTKHAHRTQ